ncbi:DUF349 domain-containing protein [Saccharospirillum sp. HFRX-1]|uniref:DUF349 domain-containing protein n=1 Tax=unclassified Saccharospirillum TaxID=2633430 RepID=UPI0037104919
MAALSKLFNNKKASNTPVKSTQNTDRTEPSELAQRSHSPDRRQRQTALAELANRLDDGRLDDAELDNLPLTPLDHLALQLQRDAQLDGLSDEDCFTLAVEGFSAQVRNAAAERLRDQQQLEALARAAKGHDKAVYRIARDKLDAQRAQEREHQAEREQAHSLVARMERHAEASLDPLYVGKLTALNNHWQEYRQHAEPSWQQRFEQAWQKAQARVAARAQTPQQTSDEASTDGVDSANELNNINQHRQAIVERILDELRERTDALDIDDAALRDAQHFLTDQQHQWQETEQQARPDKTEERAFHRLCTAFETALSHQAAISQRFGPMQTLLTQLENSPEKLNAEAQALDEWLHELDWPENTPAPQLKARVEQALARHHDQLAEHHQAEIQSVRQARGLMRRCMAAVNEGHLRRASGLLHGVEETLAKLKHTAHPGLFRQLEETKSAVEQLRDWQSFAVQPKKEALIERMRALIGQSLDPQDRARTIRQMQDEWRQLSRGLQNQHQEMWESFHALAQQAYEPCREYFNEQSKLRSLNLKKRHELVEQLKQYEALIQNGGTDIKELDRVLNMARQDWRRFSPVDRAANKGVQKAFDAAIKRLRAQLQDEQVDFRRAKEAIIERAQALLDEPDTRKATETAKQLQKEWQQVGTLARRDEQSLWKAFRVVCDELFARRGQQVEAFKAELDEHRRQAEALIEQLEALPKTDQPLTEKAQVEELKAQFRALGALPKAQQKALQERFNEAQHQFDAACREQHRQRRDQHWQALIDWVAQARFDGSDDAKLVETFHALKLPANATGLVDCIEQWRQPATVEAQTQLHRQTIELEALVQVDSPAEDKNLRMELQVQRLADGLGQTVDQQRVDQAVLDWLACGSVEQPDYDRLAARMQAARQAWLDRKN